jgi:hypothetical protein
LCENTTPGQEPGPIRLSANAIAAGFTLGQALGQDSAAAVRARAAQDKADAAKARAVAIAKELGKIVADELGITDALDCFTTGALGACGSTALNIVSSVVSGGPLGKLIAKYWYRVNKAYALGKRIVHLAKTLWGAFKDWKKTSKAAKAACLNSFVGGTLVLMADGSTKRIEDIDIGDQVLATDPETGKTEKETVTAEIKGTGLKHLVKVTVDIDGKSGHKKASVTATDGHPFWVPELRDWIKATDLKAGEWLRTSAGTHVQITAVKRWTVQRATVHNLTVAGEHTYYVLAGAAPLLVHNTGGACPTSLYHYTNQAGHDAIVASGQLNPSLKALKPQDARLGDGQYLSDVQPGTKTLGQLARNFFGTPWGGQRFTHFLEIDVSGLDLVTDPERPGVFLIPGKEPLDISNRIIRSGTN